MVDAAPQKIWRADDGNGEEPDESQNAYFQPLNAFAFCVPTLGIHVSAKIDLGCISSDLGDLNRKLMDFEA